MDALVKAAADLQTEIGAAVENLKLAELLKELDELNAQMAKSAVIAARVKVTELATPKC